MLSRRARLSLGVLVLGHGGLLAALALLRYTSVHQRTFDLALYARIAWGLSRGDFWSPVLDTHAFGAHLAWVLVPLGLLGRAPGTLVPVLLCAQAAAVALSAIPLARIGARRLGHRGAVLGALAWLLYPNLGHVATYEFHPGTLAVLPLCWAFDALDRSHFVHVCACAAAMLLCREDLALTTAALGAVYFGLHRDVRGAWLSVFSLAYLGLSMAVVTAHAPAVSSLDLHFGPWGGTPFGIVRALVSEPRRVLAHFLAPARLWYLARVLAPLSFFSLRAPLQLAVALPTLALNLVSVFPTAQQQYSHYLTPAVPGIVVASVVGLSATRSRFVQAMAACALGVGQVALGGMPWSVDFARSAFVEDAQTQAARRVLAQIPPAASVQAPDPLLPHLAERPILRRGPPPDAGAEYTVLDVSHRLRFRHEESVLRTVEEPLVRRFFERTDQALVAYEPPYALFRRGVAPRESALFKRHLVQPAGPDLGVRLADCVSLAHAKLLGDTLALTLRAHGPCPADLALRLGSTPRPSRVELLADGAVSPSWLRAGDLLRVEYEVGGPLRAELKAGGLWLGALRSSGAPPEPAYPVAVHSGLD